MSLTLKKKYLMFKDKMNPSPSEQEQYKFWVVNSIENLKQLEGIELIEKSQEFFAIVYDQYAETEVKHTQNTKDEEADKEYSFLRNEIRPLLKEAEAEIAKKVLQKNNYPKQFIQYIRQAKITNELFHPDIPNLQRQESELETRYTKKYSSLTINVDGKEYPISMSGKFLESFKKDTRIQAWQSIKKAFLENQDFFEETYLKLISIRKEIARKAKCKDYVEYQFKNKLRDYTVEDCHDFHEAVKKHITPIITEFQKERKQKLNLEKLYPYDASFSITTEYELFPFNKDDEEKLFLGIKKAIERVSPGIAEHFQNMKDNKRLDLISRNNKAPGGYNMPFILKPYSFVFMNATGTHQNLNTLAHEEGHAWHGNLAKKLHYPFEKEYSTEVAEVASTFLEYASSSYLNYFYSEKELAWSLIDQLKGELSLLAWIAIIDKFQHLVYAEEDLTKEKLRKIWLNVFREFRGKEISWDEDKDLERIRYAQQHHLFSHPLYYIEYAISLIAATQLWKIFETNQEKALDQYNKGLSLGNT